MATTILIVDHEAEVREIIACMLMSAGYVCLQVSSGPEAIALLDSGEKVDLITSALLMPELDGLGLLQQVKEKYPRMPFVVVSAVHDKSVAEAVLCAGASDYILKPFESDQLVTAVDGILGIRRARPELAYQDLLELPPRDGQAATGTGGAWYWIGYVVCWIVLFLGCWIYCIASYGFLLGVGLGWLPSAIAASLLSFLWPLVVVALVIVAYALFAK
jgi:two-component system, chemotaxis family, chemotaxis protein CheY